MPNPGVVNNPGGSNGTETAYGEIKRRTQMTRAAPVPGTPALEAPRRAKRKAGRNGGAVPATPAPVTVPAPEQITPQASLASVWAQLAAEPGASDLVKEYAARARQLGV